MKTRIRTLSLTSVALVALSAYSAAQSGLVGWGFYRFDSSWGQGPFAAVRGGWGNTQAIRADGSAVAWGINWSDVCAVPALPPGLTYVALESGEDFTVALRSDGSVVAWGANYGGQCNVPPLPPGVTYVEVEMGYGYSLARRSDGSVVAWGNNAFGQCNVPALPPGLTYTQVSGRGANNTPFGVHACHSVALRSDGSVIAWGDNLNGQHHVPALPPGSSYEEISASGNFTIARVGDGSGCAAPTNYCVSAINSTGHGAYIGFHGSTSIAANDLVLLVSGGPPSHAGIFFFGRFQTQIPFGEGYLCATGGQHRVMQVVTLDAGGAGSLPLDYTNPASAAYLITAGSEWNFQFWYRDWQPVAHGFNFTNALNAHFCP